MDSVGISGRGWKKAAFASIAIGAVSLGLAFAIGLNPIDTDVKYDWLSAAGGVNRDAYDDVLDLAVEFDVHVGVNVPPGLTRPGAHPRTPGAILLALPLLLFDYDHLFAVATFITIACGAAILWPVLGVADRNDRFVLVVLAAICAPTLVTLRYSSQASLVAALTLFAWPLLFRGKGLVGGGALAVAGALKIFPLILVVPLILRRRYFASGAIIAGFLLLNAGGLALPGVSLAGAWRALTAASETWVDMGSNGSLVTVFHGLGLSPRVALLLVVVLVSLFLGFSLKTRKERMLGDPLPWIIAGLLIIPLSWISYDLIILPALSCLFIAKARRPRLVGMAGWAFWIAPALVYSFVLVGLGTSSVVVRLMMLGVWWAGWLTWTNKGFNSIWAVPPLPTRVSNRVDATRLE